MAFLSSQRYTSVARGNGTGFIHRGRGFYTAVLRPHLTNKPPTVRKGALRYLGTARSNCLSTGCKQRTGYLQWSRAAKLLCPIHGPRVKRLSHALRQVPPLHLVLVGRFAVRLLPEEKAVNPYARPESFAAQIPAVSIRAQGQVCIGFFLAQSRDKAAQPLIQPDKELPQVVAEYFTPARLHTASATRSSDTDQRQAKRGPSAGQSPVRSCYRPESIPWSRRGRGRAQGPP